MGRAAGRGHARREHAGRRRATGRHSHGRHARREHAHRGHSHRRHATHRSSAPGETHWGHAGGHTRGHATTSLRRHHAGRRATHAGHGAGQTCATDSREHNNSSHTEEEGASEEQAPDTLDGTRNDATKRTAWHKRTGQMMTRWQMHEMGKGREERAVAKVSGNEGRASSARASRVARRRSSPAGAAPICATGMPLPPARPIPRPAAPAPPAFERPSCEKSGSEARSKEVRG